MKEYTSRPNKSKILTGLVLAVVGGVYLLSSPSYTPKKTTATEAYRRYLEENNLDAITGLPSGLCKKIVEELSGDR